MGEFLIAVPKMFEMNENNLCENNPVHPPPIPSHANVLNIDISVATIRRVLEGD